MAEQQPAGNITGAPAYVPNEAAADTVVTAATTAAAAASLAGLPAAPVAVAPVAVPVIANLAGALVPPGPVLPRPHFDIETALMGPLPTKSHISFTIHAKID